MLRNLPLGPTLELARPVCSHLTADLLRPLSRRGQLTALYKRLFALRHCIDRQEDYVRWLRRLFSRDLDLRRRVFLGIDTPLSAAEYTRRLANTYAFVFNATCSAPAPAKVHFYHELRDVQPRMESRILDTLIATEAQKPDAIKFDRSYLWVDALTAFYAQVRPNLSRKDISTLAGKKIAHNIGFYQHEIAVMAMNEAHSLCL